MVGFEVISMPTGQPSVRVKGAVWQRDRRDTRVSGCGQLRGCKQTAGGDSLAVVSALTDPETAPRPLQPI